MKNELVQQQELQKNTSAANCADDCKDELNHPLVAACIGLQFVGMNNPHTHDVEREQRCEDTKESKQTGDITDFLCCNDMNLHGTLEDLHGSLSHMQPWKRRHDQAKNDDKDSVILWDWFGLLYSSHLGSQGTKQKAAVQSELWCWWRSLWD